MLYLKGIDISNNDGNIDFSKVANDGVTYVYVKATEGETFQDSAMEGFYNSCKSNNLKVGAYHFLVATSTPEAQAQNFYNMIKDHEWDLIPVVDVETNFDSLLDYLVKFITAFKQLSPLTLGIYSYTSFISNLTDAEETIKDMPFWEANYNNDPWNLPSNFFTNRVGHQYTESGSVSGVSGDCDMDSFTEGVLLVNSTTGEWEKGDGDNAGKWWYKYSDGSYAIGWKEIDGKWYLFDSNGWMLTGWQKDGGNWYLLGSDGAMLTGWQEEGDNWYYLNDSGVMQIGWLQLVGKWYYLNSEGAMVIGWFVVDGKDYCTYSDGSLIVNCDLYGYHFDSNGVATKIS